MVYIVFVLFFSLAATKPEEDCKSSSLVIHREPNRKVLEKITEKECPICLEDFDKSQAIIETQCISPHAFHENCLVDWCNKSETCPTCRQQVDINSIDPGQNDSSTDEELPQEGCGLITKIIKTLLCMSGTSAEDD